VAPGSTDRRGFIRGAACFGAAAAFAGCSSTKGFGGVGSMATYADSPFRKLRVGVVGLGRGQAGVEGFNALPGCEIAAICDPDAARIRRALDSIEESFGPRPAVYTGGEEEWKRLCDDDGVDLVYNASPRELRVPVALYAMNAGRHVATAVPAAFTVEDCWRLVEASERLRRHCMQLENSCYGEMEMLALNLCRLGMLGELVHAEGAYMHGLGPICWCMDVNRGDRLDYLVSLESGQFGPEPLAGSGFPAESPNAGPGVEMGDMNATLVKTKRGRSMLMRHVVDSRRPCCRINTVTGTRGVFSGCPYRVGWEKATGAGLHRFFSDVRAEKVRRMYMHPLWRQIGGLAKKTGGHGGMDFLMLLRLAYCLQNGLPLDLNVYDLATSCSLAELGERSARARSAPMDVPDFTRGAWGATAPIGDISVNLSRIGLV